MTSKFIHRIFFSFLLCAFAIQSFSQLSAGGTPPGFQFAPSGRLPIVNMPAINVDSLLAEDAINEHHKGAPYRFGYNHMVNYNPQNSGKWTVLSNGDRIWQLDVKTPGSFTINLAFSNFLLAPGAKLFVYSKDHEQVLGGFTSTNNSADKLFGTELIYGDEAVIEYYEPAAANGQNSFTLFRITQGYKDIHNYLKSFDQAGSCLNNINCPQYADYLTQKRSVVCLVSGGNEFCSGALVNDVLSDGAPYILTANHCGTADGSWVFRFNWEAPGCPNPATEPSTTQSITGGVTVAQTPVSDFNLVLMNATPPPTFHPFYAGWSRSLVPATRVTAIHHPEGDIKKCSKANNAVTDTFYDAGNGVALVWQIGLWTDGCTEPGSSGSPLFDQNKRIVGQLYGGPSECGEIPGNLRDYYGRFCVSWDSGSTPQTRLRDWLDPGNTNPLTNDGYDPYPPLDTLDAAITSITSPSGTTCSNSIAPVIMVKNEGANVITTLTVTYSVDLNAPVVYHWSGYLLSLQAVSINLPALTIATGNHTFYASVSQPNNHIDQNTSNDSASAAFIISSPTTVSMPLFEGFEEGSFPPSLWSVTTPASGTTWTQATVGGYGLTNQSAKVDEFSPGSSTAGETPGLITPAINMATVTTPAILFFDVANAGYNSLYVDSLAVLASTDCGATWTQLYLKGGTTLATAPDDTTAFVPTSGQWRTDTININAYAGISSVQFQFQLMSGYANITYIDNVNIKGAAALSLDAGLNTLTSPVANICSAQVAASFNLQNYGTTTLTATSIYYSFDGAAATLYPWTGTLAQGQSATILLPAATLAAGSHTFKAYTALPNGSADLNHSNDTLSLSFVSGQTPVVQITNNAGTCGPDTLNAGYPEATYLWSTDEYTPQILATTSGNYLVTVTSSSQCSATAAISVTVPALPIVTLHLPTDSVCLPVGTIALSGGSPTGGTYSINSVTVTAFNGSQAVQGTYPVYYTYTDNGTGCTAYTYEDLDVHNCVGIDEPGNISFVRVYPNPFTDNFNLQFSLDISQNMNADLYSIDGKKLLTVLNNQLMDAGTHHVEINTQAFTNGIYILKVNDRFFKIEKVK